MNTLRVALSLCCLLLFARVHAAGEPLPVWRICGERGELTLLGSLHMAYPQTYPLRDAILRAFDAADSLVVELDISRLDAGQVQQLMFEIGAYPPGESLRDELSTETWEDLSSFLRGRAVPIETVESMRPGLVATMLGTMRLRELGMQPDLGVDLHFLQRAGDSKPVLALETLRQQLELFIDFPSPDLLMRQTLNQLRELDDVLTPLYQAWLQGDLAGLEKLMRGDELIQYPEFEPVYRRLFDDRNHAMTEQLARLLRAGGHYFVVVGAGHLVGEQGIIALLQQAGFSARPLAPSNPPDTEPASAE